MQTVDYEQVVCLLTDQGHLLTEVKNNGNITASVIDYVGVGEPAPAKKFK